MTMPNMICSEPAQRIMTIRADVPIVLCTGFSELINEEKAKALGIRGFIMKPVDMKSLQRLSGACWMRVEYFMSWYFNEKSQNVFYGISPHDNSRW